MKLKKLFKGKKIISDYELKFDILLFLKSLP